MGDSETQHTDIKVDVWINEKSHKTLSVTSDTTCTQFGEMIAELLHIPHIVRPYFAVYSTIDGKDQVILKDSVRIAEIQHINKEYLDRWGQSNSNGFSYHLNEEVITNRIEGDAHVKSTDTGDNFIIPTVVPQHPFDAHRSVVIADRRGIGHQRSKSSPAVASGIQRGAGGSILSLEKDTIKSIVPQSVDILPRLTTHKPMLIPEEKYPQELKRTATPMPNREPVPLEEKDEAKGLGIGTAPHLEPRMANVPSPSPPRASLKTRSKTIAISLPGLPIKPSSVANNPSPLSSPTVPRAVSPSPRSITTWDETTPQGGSLGRSHGSSRGRRTSMNIFGTEMGDGSVPDNVGSKGRNTSPPPPRQRYTPPPTILSPMVGSILGTAATSTATIASPSTRQRAQTIGSKMPQKWVKVRATKPVNTAHTDGRGLQTWDSSDGLSDLLFHTLDRLKTEM